MSKISYQQFVELLEKYDNFNEITLKAMYNEFGKDLINGFFDRYYQKLPDYELDKFIKKYSAYFEQQLVDLKAETFSASDVEKMSVGDVLIKKSLAFSLMSSDFERDQAMKMNEGRKKLKIIKPLSSDNVLYPDLQLEKIFLSVRKPEDLECIARLKKLPFFLHDESILRKEYDDIKKFLKLSGNGILSRNELKEAFPNLSFTNVRPIVDLTKQVQLLEDYILAKFNFYNRNLRLVVFCAKRGSSLLSLEDKIQEGNIGLIKSINRFDVSRECKFSTYAIWWIRQTIMRSAFNDSAIIRIPVHLYEKIHKYRKFVNKYKLITGIEPSVEECATEIGVTVEDIMKIAQIPVDLISLDASIVARSNEEQTETLVDFLVDDVCIEDEVISKEFLNHILEKFSLVLTERENYVLRFRTGLNEYEREFTLEEIGKKLGVTRERVRQIESKAKRKIKRKIELEDLHSN